jgi:TPR repeat protein
MSTLGRYAFALLAFTVSVALAAADTLPPELEALRVKAESGNGIAQYNLGLAYAEGHGMPADPAEAYVWLMLASDHGSTGNYLEGMVARMSAEDLAEGNRRLDLARVRLHMPKPVVRKAAPVPPPKPPPVPTQAEKTATDLTGSFSPVPTTEPEVVQLRMKVKELEAKVAEQPDAAKKLQQLLDTRSQQLAAAQASLKDAKALVDN